MIDSYHFLGDLEVWQYVDGQAELFATGDLVNYVEGRGLMARAYEGEAVTGSDPYGSWAYYPRTAYRAYSAEGGVLPAVRAERRRGAPPVHRRIGEKVF